MTNPRRGSRGFAPIGFLVVIVILVIFVVAVIVLRPMVPWSQPPVAKESALATSTIAITSSLPINASTTPVVGVIASSTVNASGTISIIGSFASPNDIYTRTLVVPVVSEIYIQTWGYGGGTNAAGKIIPVGGFDPAVTLFRGIGSNATLIDSDDDGECPPGHIDPRTTGCLDSTLKQIGMPPGTYTFVLSASPNLPGGDSSDNPDNSQVSGTLTLGNAFLGVGRFVDVMGASRTKNFAVDISVVPAIPGP